MRTSTRVFFAATGIIGFLACSQAYGDRAGFVGFLWAMGGIMNLTLAIGALLDFPL